MSTDTTSTTTRKNSFDDALANTHGPSAARRALLAKTSAPYHVLDSHGVEIPHRDYELGENGQTVTTTATIPTEDGEVRVHLHQDVREDMDDSFGDFAAIEDDDGDEDVIWTVVGLEDETVDLTVVGDWGKRRHVPFEEFALDYEPITTTVGTPKFGY